MELLIQEKQRTTADHRQYPEDPMAMSTVDEDVYDLDGTDGLKAFWAQRRDEGSVPEIQQGEGMVSLVWKSGADVAMRSTNILYDASGVEKSEVIKALEEVYGVIESEKE